TKQGTARRLVLTVTHFVVLALYLASFVARYGQDSFSSGSGSNKATVIIAEVACTCHGRAPRSLRRRSIESGVIGSGGRQQSSRNVSGNKRFSNGMFWSAASRASRCRDVWSRRAARGSFSRQAFTAGGACETIRSGGTLSGSWAVLIPSCTACNHLRASRAAALRRMRGIFISCGTVRGLDFATAISVRSFSNLPGGRSRDLASFSRVVHSERTIASVLRSRIS